MVWARHFSISMLVTCRLLTRTDTLAVLQEFVRGVVVKRFIEAVNENSGSAFGCRE